MITLQQRPAVISDKWTTTVSASLVTLGSAATNARNCLLCNETLSWQSVTRDYEHPHSSQNRRGAEKADLAHDTDAASASQEQLARE